MLMQAGAQTLPSEYNKDFAWTTGTVLPRLASTNDDISWVSGEPTQPTSLGKYPCPDWFRAGSDCPQIMLALTTQSANYPGMWGDVNTVEKFPFVCQWPTSKFLQYLCEIKPEDVCA